MVEKQRVGWERIGSVVGNRAEGQNNHNELRLGHGSGCFEQDPCKERSREKERRKKRSKKEEELEQEKV